MSLSSYNPRDRYRERAVQRFNKALLFLILLGGAATGGFMMGRQNATMQIASLKDDAQEKEKKLQELQNELTTLRADARTATSRLETLKTQYEKDLPQEGPMREIFDMIKKQVDDGMAPERLAFVIRSARPPSNCSDPVSKRFVVRPPSYKGPESTVSVGEGAVTISAIGEAARGSTGQVEAWYDPTQKITLTFKTADGATEEKSGTLPLQHSIIAGGREYRFNLTEGEKSFAKVTFDSCDYP